MKLSALIKLSMLRLPEVVPRWLVWVQLHHSCSHCDLVLFNASLNCGGVDRTDVLAPHTAHARSSEDVYDGPHWSCYQTVLPGASRILSEAMFWNLKTPTYGCMKTFTMTRAGHAIYLSANVLCYLAGLAYPLSSNISVPSN